MRELTDIGVDILRVLGARATAEVALAVHFGVPRPTMHRACLALERARLISRDRQRPVTWRLSSEGHDLLKAASAKALAGAMTPTAIEVGDGWVVGMNPPRFG